MLIKSFGCSFIFGTDLADDGRDGPIATPSQFSWPALIAKSMGYQYQCFARPGSGNLQILDRLLSQIATGEPALYVIGWTWIDRFDYIAQDAPRWCSPPGVPGWKTIMPIDQDPVAETYYRHLHSEQRDKLTSLICVKSAIDALNAAGAAFIMTNMDFLLLDDRWNLTPGMSMLQGQVKPYLSDFQEQNFLDFSKQKGYAISATSHPLEDAHRAAADLILHDLDRYVMK